MSKAKIYRITPRHLLFNILKYSNGKISRKRLMDSIYETGRILAGKGYSLPFECGEIDQKIKGWENGNLFQINLNKEEYSFICEACSLEHIVDRINWDLNKKAHRDLINAIKESMKTK